MGTRCSSNWNDKISFYENWIDMQTVTVSSKFQVVIPQAVREPMNLKPGTKLGVLRIGRRIELVPIPTLAELQAQLKGCGTEIVDDPERF
jgi:AbrB family looped-hinge helix DNA binding protein